MGGSWEWVGPGSGWVLGVGEIHSHAHHLPQYVYSLDFELMGTSIYIDPMCGVPNLVSAGC